MKKVLNVNGQTVTNLEGMSTQTDCDFPTVMRDAGTRSAVVASCVRVGSRCDTAGHGVCFHHPYCRGKLNHVRECRGLGRSSEHSTRTGRLVS